MKDWKAGARWAVPLGVLLLIAACGTSTEGGKSDEAMVAACVADGEDAGVCKCQADMLKKELDKESYAALVKFTDAMASAVDQEKGRVAMEATRDPRLVAALEKVEAAHRDCRRLAVVGQFQADVDAAEAAREARRKSRAGRKCPHTAATSPPLVGQPSADVAELRLGLSFSDVEAIIECRDEVLNFDVAASWARKNQELPTRQLLRAANGDPCPAEMRAAKDAGCEDGGYSFAPLHNVTEEFIVAFTGMPEAEQAGIIWRRTVFPESAYPTVTSLQEALVEKYGAPHLQANQEGYYSLGHRRGTLVYSWVYDANGRSIPSSDSTPRSRCVNGPRPTFNRSMEWNPGCGLTVRAEIVAAPGNTLLARELNVIVMDQKRFNDAVKQFEVDIKTAVEAQHRDRGAKPDL